jgi:2'-5' RNA ligase
VAREALTRLSQDVAARSGGKAPAASNVHLTLAFLGEVEPSRISTLVALGAAVAAAVPPFRLELDRVGTFRGSGIVWAGASAVPAEMTRLVAELSAALAAGGFVLDPRPFHAHVTLARRCRKRVDVSMAAPIAWPVERLVLNASELAPDGPRYRELAGWTLGCAGCGPS